MIARERAIIAHIDPQPPLARLMPGEHRHRRFIAVNPLGPEHVSADEFIHRLHQLRATADLIGQRRQAQVDAFAPITLALAIERLMLAIFLEQDHGQQARAGKAARQHMEGSRRLADLFARPAGELLAHMLDDLPLPGNDFERLSDILADLGKPGRAAARALRRPGNDDPLARQMCGKRLARGLLAREGANHGGVAGCSSRLLGSKIILRGRRFELLKLEFQLVEQPRLALVARPKNLPSQFLDGEPEMRDQRLRTRRLGALVGKLGLASTNETLQHLDIIGQRITSAHHHRRNHKSSQL